MPASIGVNLRVTGHCSQGGRKYMEDLFSVAYQQTEDEKDLEYAFFGIYDGHGGREAAAFAKEHLMDAIVKQRQFWSDNDEDVLKAIRNGYMLTHLNMWKELDKWPKTVTGLPSTAGTTASIAFIRKGKIYIGHVGDSAIILGYQKEGCDDWLARPLTLDHKPESAAEIERIHQSGGKVVSKAGVPRVVWNRPRPGHRGPMNKNTPVDEIPFLAVARSLGDLWSYNLQNDEFIVSPDPDVGVLTIDPSKFRCLIFGTDGLWNMVSAEAAVGLVQATEQHNEAAVVASADAAAGAQPRDWLNPSKSLVDNALERWSNTRMRADNTSVVTLMLDPPGPPRAAVLRSRAPRLTPVTPPRPSECQEQDKKSSTLESCTAEAPCTTGKESASPVPQNGLAIVTRYPESEATTPPPRAPALTPLPPCASLDGRFSNANNGCLADNFPGQPDQEEEDEEREAMTNYGNPSESYFISRLLNRTSVCNSLSNVYDEIIYGPAVETVLEEAKPSADMLSQKDSITVPDVTGEDTAALFATISQHAPLADQTAHMEKLTIRDKVTVCSSSGAPADGTGYVFPADADIEPVGRDAASGPSSPDESEESIQINEVSSSSPIDVPPKPKGRRPKTQAKSNFQAQLPHGRSLRSHDVCTMHRPQTRFTSHRARPVPLVCPDRTFEAKPLVAIPRNNNNNVDNADRNAPACTDRVVILNRTRCEPVAPPARPPLPPARSEPLVRSNKLTVRVTKTPGAEPKLAVKPNATERADARRPAPPPRIPEGPPRHVQTNVRITRSRDGVAECEPRRRHLPPEPPEGMVRPLRPEEVVRAAARARSTAPVPLVEARFTGRPFPIASPSKILDGPPECSKENFIGRPSTAGRPSGFTEGVGRGKRRGGAVSPAHLQPSEKRRTRLDDKRTAALHDTGYLLALNIASAGVHAALPLGRRHGGRTAGKPERRPVAEVHSTTSESGDGALEADGATPLRTLRTRNECHPAAESGGRRALRSSDNLRPEEVSPDKGAGGVRQVLRSHNEAAESQRVTRSSRLPAALSMAKRLTGRANWPPALTTRNRLRKRLSK